MGPKIDYGPVINKPIDRPDDISKIFKNMSRLNKIAPKCVVTQPNCPKMCCDPTNIPSHKYPP